MQYILTQEEFNNFVPRQELKEAVDIQNALIIAFRNSDACIQHLYNDNAYCDDCPIASLNLKPEHIRYKKICKDQRFSK